MARIGLDLTTSPVQFSSLPGVWHTHVACSFIHMLSPQYVGWLHAHLYQGSTRGTEVSL